MLSSTIVEIIMALQPCAVSWFRDRAIYNSRNYYGIIAKARKQEKMQIYNSRNYYGIIAIHRRNYCVTISTIVEIIMALQPQKRYVFICSNLQQQKLLWHYSRNEKRAIKTKHLQQQKLLWHYSLTDKYLIDALKSTIVEIIMALQPPRTAIKTVLSHLQQQKLLWHYSQ